MSDTIVSPTGDNTALTHESLTPIVLFTTRTVRNFSQPAPNNFVSAGNIAAPGAATDRDAGGPLAGLGPSRISIEGIDPQGIYFEIEATLSAGITTCACTVLYYTSEDGVTWHFWTSSTISDTNALVSGNPSDVGLPVPPATGGTDFRAFGPFAGLTPPPGTKYLAVAIRNNTNVAGNDLTISCRIVKRPT